MHSKHLDATCIATLAQPCVTHRTQDVKTAGLCFHVAGILLRLSQCLLGSTDQRCTSVVPETRRANEACPGRIEARRFSPYRVSLLYPLIWRLLPSHCQGPEGLLTRRNPAPVLRRWSWPTRTMLIHTNTSRLFRQSRRCWQEPFSGPGAGQTRQTRSRLLPVFATRSKMVCGDRGCRQNAAQQAWQKICLPCNIKNPQRPAQGFYCNI